nr:MFS transporter [Propionibacterium sp.]
MTRRGARAGVPREIWVLVAAAFVVALGYGLISPILPQFAASFGVGIGAASAIVSAFALMRMVFAPAGGALVNRFGERSVYIAGLLIVAGSTAACAFAQSYEQLLVVRGLGGVGSTMFTISAMGLIVRVAPIEMRGRVSALYGAAFLSGNIAGPLLGTALAFLGYRTPFLIYAVALLIAASVVAVNLARVQAARPAADGRTRPTPADARPPLSLTEALRLPAYRALLAAQFVNGWSTFGVRISLLPLLAAAVPTLGAPLAGLGLTAFALGNFLVLQFSGRLVDARGRRGVVLAGLLLGGAVSIPFGWMTQPAPFLVLAALAGAGAALVQPAQQAAFADVLGRDRAGGQALSTFSMAGDLGGFLGPIVTGLIADRAGFGWAFTISGLLLILGALPWWRSPDTLRRTPA